jgi:hypothetical protein
MLCSSSAFERRSAGRGDTNTRGGGRRAQLDKRKGRCYATAAATTEPIRQRDFEVVGIRWVQIGVTGLRDDPPGTPDRHRRNRQHDPRDFSIAY